MTNPNEIEAAINRLNSFVKRLIGECGRDQQTAKDIEALISAASARGVADDPIDAIARAVCWHHFGMAWEHAERQSHADIRKMVRDMLAAPSSPAATPDQSTVDFVREWMMSGDHPESDWERHFAAAIDDRAGWRGSPALMARIYEVVHHDSDCKAIGGAGDRDCTCDAVLVLRTIETLWNLPVGQRPAATPEVEREAVDELFKDALNEHGAQGYGRDRPEQRYFTNHVVALHEAVMSALRTPRATGPYTSDGYKLLFQGEQVSRWDQSWMPALVAPYRNAEWAALEAEMSRRAALEATV